MTNLLEPRQRKVVFVVVVVLAIGLAFALNGRTPTLSIMVLILTTLLIATRPLERLGRLIWLPSAVASALAAAYLGLALQWGFIKGNERILWVVLFGILTVVGALSAVLAAVRSRDNHDTFPEPPNA